jgi:hypothetical protein
MTTRQRITLAIIFLPMLAIWVCFEVSVWSYVAIFLSP